MMFFDDGDAGYLVDEPSDDEGNLCSSDEENEDLFNEFMNDRPKNSTNDFLLEMNKELNETVAKVEEKSNLSKKKYLPIDNISKPSNKEDGKDSEQKLPAGETSKSSTGETSKSSNNQDEKDSEQKFYDDIYFDSDDSDEEPPLDRKQKRKHPVLSNDDLFYDPDVDDEDQKWIDDYRRKCQPPPANSSKPQPLPTSDAVLNCPACLSLLCLDCQRHSVYATQYRAMFVQNCSVNLAENLQYPTKNQKQRKQKKFVASNDGDEVYHPVTCRVCNTEVAVYDSDEVYHFFNVISSYS